MFSNILEFLTAFFKPLIAVVMSIIGMVNPVPDAPVVDELEKVIIMHPEQKEELEDKKEQILAEIGERIMASPPEPDPNQALNPVTFDAFCGKDHLQMARMAMSIYQRGLGWAYTKSLIEEATNPDVMALMLSMARERERMGEDKQHVAIMAFSNEINDICVRGHF
jgi:hypothetical protein